MLIVGLALIFNVQIRNMYLNHLSTQYQLGDLTREDIVRNEKKKANFKFEEIQPLGYDVFYKRESDVPIIGGIGIEKINLKMPIVKGLSNYGLFFGAGTMTEDQKMGEGNYSLAAHNSNQPGMLFSDLYKLEKGNKIYLTDLKYVFEYNVTSLERVDPSRVDVIDVVPGERLVTLVSCNQDSSMRVIVHGEFVGKTLLEDTPDDILVTVGVKKEVTEVPASKKE